MLYFIFSPKCSECSLLKLSLVITMRKEEKNVHNHWCQLKVNTSFLFTLPITLEVFLGSTEIDNADSNRSSNNNNSSRNSEIVVHRII